MIALLKFPGILGSDKRRYGLSFYTKAIDEDTGDEILEVSLSGQLLLDYSLLNKGSAFTDDERREFNVLGLLPPHVSTVEEQLIRNYANFKSKPTDLERYIFLVSLQDRNETLFYKLLEENLAEMMPIIYTPVVGAASQFYSHIFRRPRGLFISYPHRAEMDAMLANAPSSEVSVIVVTDGERILGLGDLGVGGMGIPVGKLSLYTSCAGIPPEKTLPILLDVGTNNQELLRDPLYIGWRHQRISGQAYDDFIEAFIEGVMRRFPNALLQWEDFARHNARRLLEKYRHRLCSFNDDIQGTGAVTTGALLAASKVVGEKLSQQQIVMFGAGSAATGIAEQIIAAMMLEGLSEQEAKARLWLIDIGGLIHSGRNDVETISLPFAQSKARIGGWQLPNPGYITLADVVRNAHPTVLIGTSAQPGSFTKEIIEDMAKHTAHPIIFPLSNPTSKCEAHPADILAWTAGRAIIATGSPFAPVPASLYGGEGLRTIGQCNNSYIFPGVGLGVIASGARRVTNEMFAAAAMALSNLSPALSDPTASLFPALEEIRMVSRTVAIAVSTQAQREGLAEQTSQQELERCVDALMWKPRYLRYRRKVE
jgi:malate dehydrogenase (oxaloacetate-decarboxylating)